MSAKGQLTGARGVYLVAAYLTKLGYIASTTSRNAAMANILVTDLHCSRTFSVQVKTNASVFTFWLLGASAKKIKSESYIYVLVNIRSRKSGEEIEYFVIPSNFEKAK